MAGLALECAGRARRGLVVCIVTVKGDQLAAGTVHRLRELQGRPGNGDMQALLRVGLLQRGRSRFRGWAGQRLRTLPETEPRNMLVSGPLCMGAQQNKETGRPD